MIEFEDGGQYAYAKGQLNLCDTLLDYSEICGCTLERMVDFIEQIKKASIEMISRVQEDKLRMVMQCPKYWKEQDPEYVDMVEKLQKEVFPKKESK